MKFLMLLAVFASCANVTTTKLTRLPNGQIAINSGKDVKIGCLFYQTDPTGASVALAIKDYSSTTNPDVVNAQAAREEQVIQGVLQGITTGLAAAGKVAALDTAPPPPPDPCAALFQRAAEPSVTTTRQR